jgi:cytochrome c oxidase subunit III
MDTETSPRYFVPGPSAYPVLASLGLLVLTLGASAWVNRIAAGRILSAIGLVWFVGILYFWFRQAIYESETGRYKQNVDRSYRWSMSWFIFSEITFFAAFFAALLYVRSIALPALGDLDHKVLWPDFSSRWPSLGPAGLVENFATIGPWPWPTISTVLLLTSGFTLTWAHHALRENQRTKTLWGLGLTVALGIAFMACQSYEYAHAYAALHLRLDSGIYGSTFFMLTGFHGLHVLLGTIMLFCIFIRVGRGHFSPTQHFAFDGVAWYWHFVDVVWLGLYLVIYCL